MPFAQFKRPLIAIGQEGKYVSGAYQPQGRDRHLVNDSSGVSELATLALHTALSAVIVMKAAGLQAISAVVR